MYIRLTTILFIMLCSIYSSLATAVIVSIDWKTTGDNLVTRDTSTGLDWLDLTETNNMSRSDVLVQLGGGGLFEEWRYANSAETVILWSNLGVDLDTTNYWSAGAHGLDPAVSYAVSFLGNIFCEYDCNNFPYGVRGATADPIPTNSELYALLGAYASIQYGNEETYYSSPSNTTSGYFVSNGYAHVNFGSYLVREVTAVPVPAAVWLFGTGLIGLAGFSKRKKV